MGYLAWGYGMGIWCIWHGVMVWEYGVFGMGLWYGNMEVFGMGLWYGNIPGVIRGCHKSFH